MGNVGGGELLLIFLVILLLFGSKRIPEMARGLGRGIREFREATREIQRELTLEEPSYRARNSTPGQAAGQDRPPSTAAAAGRAPDHEARPPGEGAGPGAATSETAGSDRPDPLIDG